MQNELEILKSLILEIDSENFKTQSTLVDQFLKDHSSDIKYKLLEMWTEYLLQHENESYFSNN